MWVQNLNKSEAKQQATNKYIWNTMQDSLSEYFNKQLLNVYVDKHEIHYTKNVKTCEYLENQMAHRYPLRTINLI